MQPLKRVRDPIQEPKNISNWCTKTVKGGFYLSDKPDGIVSNSFAFDLQSDSNIFFSIEPFKTTLHTSIFINNNSKYITEIDF